MQNARRGFSHGIPHNNAMLIKQDGNLQKRHYTQTMLHFCNILSFFIDDVFLLIMSKFFGANNTCILFSFKFTIYNTMSHVFCIRLQCLLFMERFGCNLHAYAAYLQYRKTRDGQKCVKNFGVLGVSGLNK